MKRFEQWLNQKVDDYTISSEYENSKYNLDVILRKYEPTSSFSYYYEDNDIDIRNNNDYHLNLLDEYKKDDFDPLDDDELDRLEFLDQIAERYKPKSFFRMMGYNGFDDANWETVDSKSSKGYITNNKPEEIDEEITILIPPNTNRYHANYLFKRMVQYSINNNMYYDVEDPYKDVYRTELLVEPDIKEAFYKFCYHNTHKNKRI